MRRGVGVRRAVRADVDVVEWARGRDRIEIGPVLAEGASVDVDAACRRGLSLDDGSLGAALAAAGAVRAATFSMDGLAEHYLELYRSAIAGVAPV